jgi:hypothetical protein
VIFSLVVTGFQLTRSLMQFGSITVSIEPTYSRRSVGRTSEQIVAATQKHDLLITYVLHLDEGHGILRTENRRSYHALVEAFLAEHLGGWCEPVGDDFDGSSLQVLAGRDPIPGL